MLTELTISSQRGQQTTFWWLIGIVYHADVLTIKGASCRLRGRGIDRLPSIRTTMSDSPVPLAGQADLRLVDGLSIRDERVGSAAAHVS
jgi:hypothetical protein